MDDIMLSNQQQQQQQEQSIILQQQQEQTQKLNEMQQPQEMQPNYDMAKLSDGQRAVYRKFLSRAEKQRLVEASDVAEGSPVQEYKPEKETVKKKVSNWWGRSKRTKKAKEMFGSKNADYATYDIISKENEMKEQFNPQVNELVQRCKENNLPEASFDKLGRCGYFLFQECKKDEEGNPLTEKDQAAMEANQKVIQSYSTGKLEDRRPLLNHLVNEAINFKFTPDMLNKDYLVRNYGELRKKMSLIGELHALLHEDPVNKEYYDGLPESIKQRLTFAENFQKEYAMAFIFRLREFGVDFNTGTFEDYKAMGREAIGMEYQIEENGKTVEKYMTHTEYYQKQYLKYAKKHSDEIKQLDTPMTVESAVTEEVMRPHKDYLDPLEEQIAQDKELAKKEFNNDPDVDHITYRVTKNRLHAVANRSEAQQKFIDRMNATKHGVEVERISSVLVHGYEKDENGNPLNEQEQKKKEEDEKFIEAYASGKTEDRIPYLDKFIERILNAKFGYDIINEETLYTNSEELIMDYLYVLNYQNILLADPINKAYMDILPDSVIDRLEDISMVCRAYTPFFNGLLEQHKLKLNGDQGAYTYSKSATVRDQVEMVDDDGEELYDEAGFVRMQYMDAKEIGKQNTEEELKKIESELQRIATPMNLEEEIKTHGFRKEPRTEYKSYM